MKTTFLIILMGCLLSVQAQTNFIPGYIITNENDTLYGLVDYRGDTRNSKRCEFKENEDAPVREFLPFSIQSYRYNDSKYYVSRTVKEDGKEIPVFMEYLVNGISDLYFYSDGKKFHYYIEKADGQLIELTNEQREFRKDSITYRKASRRYVGVMKYAFADCQQLFPVINKATLDHKSLISISRKYHEQVCKDEQCIIYEKKLQAVKISLGGSVNFNGSFLKYSDHPILESVDFQMATYPTFELQMNTALPKLSEKLSLQLSGEFGKAYFHGSHFFPNNTTFKEVHIHTNILKGKAGIKYTWPKGTLRPTVLVGGSYIWIFDTDARSIEEKQTTTSEYTKVYTSELRDIMIAHKLYSLHINLGVAYFRYKSLLPFVNVGFESAYGTKDYNLYDKLTIHLNTIQLHAGIHF